MLPVGKSFIMMLLFRKLLAATVYLYIMQLYVKSPLCDRDKMAYRKHENWSTTVFPAHFTCLTEQ